MARYVALPVFLSMVLSAAVIPQSSVTTTQTVQQRNTLGVLTATPTSGLTAGSSVAFTYVLHTAGAPAPTGETIQFYDGGTAIGAAQSISSVAGSNLLPWSQVDTANQWSALGSPVITPAADGGPDGSATSATRLVLPISTSQKQGVSYAVAGSSYASLTLTMSVWAKSSVPTTLTLGLSDNPAANAAGSSTCALTTVYQRCVLSYAFPASANSGLIASLYTQGQGAVTVDLWGAQVEQASAAGAYVSTIGTARPTGGQGSTVAYSYSGLLSGSHAITAVYSGDTNFIASTSNALSLTFAQATPSVTLTASPASPANYGTALTFTATLTGSAGAPTGTVRLMDGATLLSSATLASGVATFTLSGANALAGGSHSLTAVYDGNANYVTVTSTALPFTISKASSSVTVSAASSLNPSIYGDSVTFTVTVATTIGGITPTGTITAVDTTTSTTIGTFSLDASGKATVASPLLNAGTHSLKFTYSGDTNYQ